MLMRQIRHTFLSLELIQIIRCGYSVIQLLTAKSFHFHYEKIPLHMTFKCNV